jgi:hypothetical protein
MFGEKLQTGQDEAATGWRITLFAFEIQQSIRDHFLGDGFRRLPGIFNSPGML